MLYCSFSSPDHNSVPCFTHTKKTHFSCLFKKILDCSASFLKKNKQTSVTMTAALNRMDMQQVEYRAVIKFLTKQGKGPQAILSEMKAVYGSQCPGKTMIYKWCSAFQMGRETIEDKPRTLIHKRGRRRERRALSPIFDDSFIDKIQNELLDELEL